MGMSRREILQRLGLGAVIAIVATIVYRSIQHWRPDRALVRNECLGWDLLPFNAWWLAPYVSMFVLVGLPWVLLPKWCQVRRFAWTLLGVAAVGWITFLVYPTACVRPSAEGQPWAYTVLLALDAPTNCMPCLHSAFAVLAAWALWLDSQIFQSAVARFALVLWVATIGISIIALRQHTDVDMFMGVALGSVGGSLFSYARLFRGPAGRF
jgi:hypothetical protein